MLDLGSGAGLDCFLAAKKVGPEGQVIGLDMTDAMLEKARKNQVPLDLTNVEFRKGEMERMPIADASVDVIISNCMINLSPDKDRVFREAHRVLRRGGRLMVTDIATIGELLAELRSTEAWTGCVGGARGLITTPLTKRRVLEISLKDQPVPLGLTGSILHVTLPRCGPSAGSGAICGEVHSSFAWSRSAFRGAMPLTTLAVDHIDSCRFSPALSAGPVDNSCAEWSSRRSNAKDCSHTRCGTLWQTKMGSRVRCEEL